MYSIAASYDTAVDGRYTLERRPLHPFQVDPPTPLATSNARSTYIGLTLSTKLGGARLERSMPPQLWVPPGDAHCEFGLQWAYTYKGELGSLEQWFREKAPADAFLVALEKGAVDADGVRQPAGRGYHFTAVTLPGLVALLETVRSQPANLNLYEYLVDERPRRIGVDLEYELAEPKHREPASELWPDDFEAVFADKELFLRRTLVDVFLPALSALVGRTLTTADCYLMDSSTSTGSKQSYHVVLDVVLPDKASREAFHRWIQVRAALRNLLFVPKPCF